MNAVQCKMARAALGLGIRDLAEAAKVSPDTIARLERGEPLRERTIDAIRAALEAAGVEFTNGGQPGVRMKGLVTGGHAVTHEIKVGDWVKYREDRPPPDFKNLGSVGQIIDPGYAPPFPTHVYVRFPSGDEAWFDRGALMLVPAPA